MPIFEFRCLECGALFEKLFMSPDEKLEMACPECKGTSFERIVSRTHYAMGSGPGGTRPKVTSRSCGTENQCMTLELPGHSK